MFQIGAVGRQAPAGAVAAGAADPHRPGPGHRRRDRGGPVTTGRAGLVSAAVLAGGLATAAVGANCWRCWSWRRLSSPGSGSTRRRVSAADPPPARQPYRGPSTTALPRTTWAVTAQR